MGLRHFKIGLQSLKSGASISEAGGKCFVAQNTLSAKVALYNADGTVKANPLALVNGEIEFWTLDTVPLVDLYIQAPSGHFLTVRNVAASGPVFYALDKSCPFTVMVIPFALADAVAATEQTTGFDVPTSAIMLPVASGLSIDVLTLEAGKTIDFGTLSTEAGGSANALGSALTLAAAVVVKSAVATGIVCDGVAKTISYTLSAGTTVAAGFLKIPLLLPTASL